MLLNTNLDCGSLRMRARGFGIHKRRLAFQVNHFIPDTNLTSMETPTPTNMSTIHESQAFVNAPINKKKSKKRVLDESMAPLKKKLTVEFDG